MVRLNGLRIGIGICSDARDHADGAAYAGQHVDAMLYLLNNMLPRAVARRWRSQHLQILALRARQRSAWVFSAEVVGARGDAVAYSCTAIIDPAGRLRECVPESETGIAVATIG